MERRKGSKRSQWSDLKGLSLDYYSERKNFKESLREIRSILLPIEKLFRLPE